MVIPTDVRVATHGRASKRRTATRNTFRPHTVAALCASWLRLPRARVMARNAKVKERVESQEQARQESLSIPTRSHVGFSMVSEIAKEVMNVRTLTALRRERRSACTVHVDKPTALKGQGKGTCNLFLRTGDCRYGDKCVFSHNTCRTTPNERGRAKRSQSATPAAEWEEEEWEEDEWEEDD